LPAWPTVTFSTAHIGVTALLVSLASIRVAIAAVAIVVNVIAI
jgi:hypothetical protein